MMAEITTAYCNRCGVPHHAEIIASKGGLVGVVHCPEGELHHPLTSNAALFQRFRIQAGASFIAPPPYALRPVIHYVSITTACNMHCSVCIANACRGTRDARFLPFDEIVLRATRARAGGARLLHLFGGEPTLHPDLPGIVRRLAGLGLNVAIASNGLRLGAEPDLAPALKSAGLSRVSLQFDSLDEAVLARMGRGWLDEKRRAVNLCLNAGLKTGLNCVVTRHNLSGVADLFRFAVDAGPGLHHVTFCGAAPMGRYELAPDDCSDREEIIGALAAAPEPARPDADDFQPLPSFRAWRLQLHPDCGAHALYVRTPNGAWPMNRIVDMPRLYRLLAANRLPPSPFSRTLIPAAMLLGCIRRGRCGETRRALTGLLRGDPAYSLLNVGIANYKGAVFLNTRRLARCASVFHTAAGTVPGCLHYLTGPRFAGSHARELANGGC